MTLTLQQFRRSFGKARRAAAAGDEVIVTGSAGASYVFKATSAPKLPAKAKTFGEMAGHHFGCIDSGLGDLSTNKKYLADFGKKSMGRR